MTEPKRSFKVRDKYGYPVESQSHKAFVMYEQGANPDDVIKELGHANFNPLKKLQKMGHKVVKEWGIGRKGRPKIVKVTLIPADAAVVADVLFDLDKTKFA